MSDDLIDNGAAAKHIGIQPLILIEVRDTGMAYIQYDKIGGIAGRNLPFFATEGLRAAPQGHLIKRGPCRLPLADGHDIARAKTKTLAIFELFQFVGRRNLDI